VTPAWLLDAVAALMLAVAAVSAVRLAAAGPWRRGAVVADTDVAHLLMALAMAGTLAPGLRTLPDIAWEVAFGLLAAWFAVRVTRDAQANGVRALAGGHCAPHLMHCCSMVYMFVAMSAAAGAAGMGAMGGMAAAGSATVTLRYPALALAFALVLAGYCIWDLDQLSGRRNGLGTARVPLARMAAPGVPAPVVLAGAESASLALPGPGAPRDSGAPQGWPSAAADQEAGRPPATADEATEAGHADDEGEGAFLLSPAITIACRVAMGFAMAFMLLTAI
jgi:hypothetical protein